MWRFLFALALVLLTFNPSEYSFYHWVRHAIAADSLGAVHFFVGAMLLIGWAILIGATFNSLGKFVEGCRRPIVRA